MSPTLPQISQLPKVGVDATASCPAGLESGPRSLLGFGGPTPLATYCLLRGAFAGKLGLVPAAHPAQGQRGQRQPGRPARASSGLRPLATSSAKSWRLTSGVHARGVARPLQKMEHLLKGDRKGFKGWWAGLMKMKQEITTRDESQVISFTSDS